MLAVSACLVFFLLLLIPFIPGIIELRRPRDAAPLFIDMEYTKDPRYFGKSFKSVIKNYARSDVLHPELKNIALSRREEIQVSPSRTVLAGENITHILCISGDLSSEEKAYFHKEIYVTGDVILGSKNVVKALASDKTILFNSYTTVLRWADAERSIETREGCDLGISISCGGEIKIARACKFQRLYGFPIVTSPLNSGGRGQSLDLDSMTEIRRDAAEKDFTLPPASRIEKDLIVKNNLRIAKDCVITGNIKTYRGLTIDERVTVNGNIFSEENITVGEHTVIDGNVFSQGRVILLGNVQIGQAGKVKSVIGKSSVILGRNVRVYGYILTEGSGMVW